MPVPVLLCGSQTWIPETTHLCKIQAQDMRFLRSVKGSTRRDRTYNEVIRKELNIFDIQDSTAEKKERWSAQPNRLSDVRVPEKVWTTSIGRSRIYSFGTGAGDSPRP